MFIFLLFALTVTAVTESKWDCCNSWGCGDSIVETLREEILRADQLERLGHEVKCEKVRVDSLFFAPITIHLHCEGDEYQPPTSVQAEEIMKRLIPNYEAVAKKKIKLQRYNKAIPQET